MVWEDQATGHLMLVSDHHIRMVERWKQNGINCNIKKINEHSYNTSFYTFIITYFATAKLYLNNRYFALNFANVG